MVCPTALQFTPRSARYSSTPETTIESAIETSFRALALAAIARVAAFHEVVADHVQHDHVRIFDAAHVRMHHLNVQCRQGSQASAVATRECDGRATDRI